MHFPTVGVYIFSKITIPPDGTDRPYWLTDYNTSLTALAPTQALTLIHNPALKSIILTYLHSSHDRRPCTTPFHGFSMGLSVIIMFLFICRTGIFLHGNPVTILDFHYFCGYFLGLGFPLQLQESEGVWKTVLLTHWHSNNGPHLPPTTGFDPFEGWFHWVGVPNRNLCGTEQ